MIYDRDEMLDHIVKGQTIIIANQEQIKHNMRRQMFDSFYQWQEDTELTDIERQYQPIYWAYMNRIKESNEGNETRTS